MIPNLIGSEWRRPADGVASLPVYNPATGEVIEHVPLSGAADVDAAVQAAVKAYAGWSRTALMERVRLMFRFKALLEDNVEATTFAGNHKVFERANRFHLCGNEDLAVPVNAPGFVRIRSSYELMNKKSH